MGFFFGAIALVLFFSGIPSPISRRLPSSIQEAANPAKPARALYQFTPTGGSLITGAEVATSVSSTGSWQGALDSDGNYWSTTRANPGGLNKQIQIDGVQLYGANKLIITIEDKNVTTANGFVHQICDWVSSTSVDNAADANCTVGGWRTLHPRKTDHTNTSDISREYQIYDSYFTTRDTSPGTVISTPLSNFINTSVSNRVLLRVYSTVGSTTQHDVDFVRVEVAVDPIYEPAGLTVTVGGTTTGFLSDLIGPVGGSMNASDGEKLAVPASGSNIDFYFSFKNIKTYSEMNTILVLPEVCSTTNANWYLIASLWNFSTSAWVTIDDINLRIQSMSTCATDTEYALAFNSTLISGFNITNFISGGEIRVRFNRQFASGEDPTGFQLDRVYLMIGSVNTNTSNCEISWGTGTAANCSNTRSVHEGKTGTPGTATWQATAALEYPSSFYGQDNDDDATNAEYAASQNLSFPIVFSPNTSVTATHFAAKFRSNSSNQTANLQIRDYSGLDGTTGWAATPSTDSNNSTTYSWYDSWVSLEYTVSPYYTIDTVNNLMNLRLRTSVGNITDPGTRDWDFAMMSIRWIEETNRATVLSLYTPTGGNLATGSNVATSTSNTGSWQGALGDDGNNWSVTRANPGGVNMQLQIDGVQLYNANKMIVLFQGNNVTTADAFAFQICDWVLSTSVDNAADANCTVGGWRTLHPRKTDYTTTAAGRNHSFEIYDGYFSTRDATPGALITTPLSNFINTTNKRVLLRIYSTVNSTTQFDLDLASVESAIDPIYETSDFVKTAGGTTTNFLSDLVGSARFAGSPNASDGNKFQVPQPASSQAADFYFVLKNVKPYLGMNTMLVLPEVCVSNAALTFGVYLRNFSSSAWTQIGSDITGSACATDTDYALAANSTTITGFNFTNHISSAGEIWVRFLTNAPAATYNIQLDRLYVMLGSVNSNTAQCEISWGTGTVANCSNTRDVIEGKTATPTTSTWQATAALEYPSSYYALDNDDDATNAEYATSQNLSVPITVGPNMAVTATHFATKYRSNVSTMTSRHQIRDYSGTQGGWVNTPTAASNNSTSYSWDDSWVSDVFQTSADDTVDTVNGLMNMRIRTSVSTETGSAITRDWDFTMLSIRWVDAGPSQSQWMRHGGWFDSSYGERGQSF